VSFWQRVKWFFWPVEAKEQKKTLFMLIVLFLVSFVYSILRTLKLTILLADPDLPSQAVSYLKVFGIMPAAMIFTWLAMSMQSSLGQKKTFLGMNLMFAGLFAILTLVVLPNKEAYRLTIGGGHELIALVNSWYITLFYVAAEMWSSIMLNMLCWGIIIEVTELKESKRLYALFSLAANLATYVAGWWGSSTIDAQVSYFMSSPHPTWEQSLLFQMIVLWAAQCLIVAFFQAAMSSQEIAQQNTLDKKVQLGFWQSVAIAWKNPVVRNVSIMMISFNIIYHLVDVIHNDYVRSVFMANPKAINSYLNLVGKYLGIYAVLFSWVLSGSFVRQFGIFYSLLFTPVLWSCLTALDFMSAAGWILAVPFTWANIQIPMYLLSFSLILSVGRAAKFTIFDTAKEMSFLSLSLQDKRLGKASVDGLTSRLGKTGGAWLVIMILGQVGTIAAALLPLKMAMICAYILWFWSVFALIKVLPAEEKGAKITSAPINTVFA
jgi:AAA family ATP:ADP antiporter